MNYLKFARPGRYAGGEYNTPEKLLLSRPEGSVNICLSFPDLYEIGISNLGMLILYHILNGMENVYCERVYAPDRDMETYLRANNLPLVSVETGRPLASFDLIGFSFQNELQATNILNMLDMARIPVLRKERDKNSPVIIAGGPAVSNPAPYAEFIDLFAFGDGEDLVKKIAKEISAVKQSHSGKIEDRAALLKNLALLEGVYAPDVTPAGRSVRKNTGPLLPEYYPEKQIVPSLIPVHNRLTYELSRGCPRMCRFCHAAYINRPFRMREIKQAGEQVFRTLQNTGYNEVSLLSLSSTDCPGIEGLFETLLKKLKTKHISVSLPSIRIDSFSLKLAEFVTGVRKTGFTIAPESGSPELREKLGKKITDEEIFNSLAWMKNQGVRKAKLYFMYGFDFETEEDLLKTNELLRKMKNNFHGMDFNVTLSPYVPKPHTPLENSAFAGGGPADEIIVRMAEKENILTRGLRVNFKRHSIQAALIEAVLARGSENAGKLLYAAWALGARFDCWTDRFSFDKWLLAQEKSGVRIEDEISKKYSPAGKYPWSFVTY